VVVAQHDLEPVPKREVLVRHVVSSFPEEWLLALKSDEGEGQASWDGPGQAGVLAGGVGDDMPFGSPS
jgi:hypothetical protein